MCVSPYRHLQSVDLQSVDLHRRARAARICAWPVTVLPSGGTMLTAPCSCNSTNAARSAALARSRDSAALLSQATEGSLDRSRRHREVRRLYGFGDELRAVLTADATPWGALTLLRTADRRHFTPADVQIVASVAGDLAEGVRLALLLRGIRRGDDEHAENLDTAGLVQIAADNTITTADSTAQKCLAELRASSTGHPLPPPPLAAIAARARRIADPSATARTPARARVRTLSGQWLLVRGWALPDERPPAAAISVIIEPAPAHQLAPLIAAAYGLTSRERHVTELIARGLGTTAIASHLHLSPWTVQDHLQVNLRQDRYQHPRRTHQPHLLPALRTTPDRLHRCRTTIGPQPGA